jgi:hypothetical protein
VSFLTADGVQDVAGALQTVDTQWLRRKYFAMSEADYGAPLTEEDLDYIVKVGFAGLPDFFAKAAAAGRAMIFTVDF